MLPKTSSRKALNEVICLTLIIEKEKNHFKSRRQVLASYFFIIFVFFNAICSTLNSYCFQIFFIPDCRGDSFHSYFSNKPYSSMERLFSFGSSFNRKLIPSWTFHVYQGTKTRQL